MVKRATGGILTQRSVEIASLADEPVALAFAANVELDPDTTPAPPTETSRPSFAYGRLLDRQGVHHMDGVQIIISVTREGQTEPDVPTAVTTEAQATSRSTIRSVASWQRARTSGSTW